jgi:hypothetical protein
MGKRGPKPTPTKILSMRGSWRAKRKPGFPFPSQTTKGFVKPTEVTLRDLAEKVMTFGTDNLTHVSRLW